MNLLPEQGRMRKKRKWNISLSGKDTLDQNKLIEEMKDDGMKMRWTAWDLQDDPRVQKYKMVSQPSGSSEQDSLQSLKNMSKEEKLKLLRKLDKMEKKEKKKKSKKSKHKKHKRS